MTVDQISIFCLLAATVGIFIWNRWRYDIVAGMALLASIYLGLVDTDHAFSGFSHPAVITVACVLVISKALQNSGLVDLLLRLLAGSRHSITGQITANCCIAGLLSAFMNNIGALALMLPVSVRDAAKAKRSASRVLMPLSFASLLGGLVTLIGTPPNIIIATYRGDTLGEPFGMFDFTPVGLVVALAGLLFIVTIGWRLIPARNDDSDIEDRFHIARYLTEAKLTEGSSLINATVGDLEKICDNEITVTAIIRHRRNRLAPSNSEKILEGDVLVLQGESESLQPLFETPGIVQVGVEGIPEDLMQSEDVRVVEAVVMPNSLRNKPACGFETGRQSHVQAGPDPVQDGRPVTPAGLGKDTAAVREQPGLHDPGQ
jgi:di/tricarboxylate transporter